MWGTPIQSYSLACIGVHWRSLACQKGVSLSSACPKRWKSFFEDLNFKIPGETCPGSTLHLRPDSKTFTCFPRETVLFQILGFVDLDINFEDPDPGKL